MKADAERIECFRELGARALDRTGRVIPNATVNVVVHFSGANPSPDGQIVINDNCIGCGACAARCPYDNIRMGDRRPPGAEQPRGGLWQLIRDLGRPRGHGAITFEQNDLRAKVAVKCDLCVGYRDGPACVRNCPTGAAFRADGASFFGSGEQISLLASVERRRPTQP